MVSLRILATSALVLFAACSVQGTFQEPRAVVQCYSTYYHKNHWKLDGVLGVVDNLLSGVVSIVDSVLGDVLSILGLGGGGGGAGSNDFGKFFVRPRSNGDVLNFLAKVIAASQPIFNNIVPGLGDFYVKAATAGLIMGASARGGNDFQGLNFKLLSGDQSQWQQQLNIQNLGDDWQSWLDNNNIDLGSLRGPRGLAINSVDSLIQKVTGGVGGIVDGLLDDVLETAWGLLSLLGSLVGDLFDSLLGLGGDYCGSVLNTIPRSTFESNIRSYYGGYSTSDYNSFFN